ncbi:VOC family protein [Kitasatospora arboriphila]
MLAAPRSSPRRPRRPPGADPTTAPRPPHDTGRHTWQAIRPHDPPTAREHPPDVGGAAYPERHDFDHRLPGPDQHRHPRGHRPGPLHGLLRGTGLAPLGGVQSGDRLVPHRRLRPRPVPRGRTGRRRRRPGGRRAVLPRGDPRGEPGVHREGGRRAHHGRRRGATVVKPPAATSWGGYSGYFEDPDGHLWELAHNPFFPFTEDGSLDLP